MTVESTGHPQSNDVYYGTNLATTAESLIRWHQLRDKENCKLQVLSNECCLNFMEQIIDERNHFSSLGHCLRPSEWRVRRHVGRLFRAPAKLRYLYELYFYAEFKLSSHVIVAQLARLLQPNFTSIQPLPTFTRCDKFGAMPK